MPLDPDTRRVPITPQLALRVAGVGVTAFVLFGIVFFRLWYLQVLDGDKYLAEARENRVRVERIEAPRGEIRDANNISLVKNRPATVVSLDPAQLPKDYTSAAAAWGQKMGQRQLRKKHGRKVGPPPAMPQAQGELDTLYHRLARVLQLSPKTINRRVVASLVQVPYADARIDTATDAERDYLVERKDQFPGVTVSETYVRRYPYGTAAAVMFGKVGQITEDQLKEKRFDGVASGATIGQSGLEYEYDQYLRGTDGSNRIEVNALGERRNAVAAKRPKVGRSLKLTLDVGLQEAGEAALRKSGGGLPGAFVAMNPKTGAIYGMGSLPTFNPRRLNSPFATKAAYDALFGEAAGSPLYNRATGGLYPTGSVFKPITALAAMEAGVMSPNDTFNDTGCLQIGARAKIDVACNAGKVANGPVNLRTALEVSSDTYFYDLGKKLYNAKGLPLQSWARKLGLGRKTGIDLPYEERGTLPDPAWVREMNRRELACRKREHKQSCGIGSGEAVWLPGNETQLAVGQGDLQATPLQMAVAYSTIINGGTVPRPHLASQITDDRGVVQTIEPAARRHLKIDPGMRSAIMDGLFLAANGPKGTSTGVWKDGWPHDRYPIYGKTGTAERPPQPDQSWYVGYSYDKAHPNDRPIVVVATIERGGWGATAAAPAVRLIMSKWFNVKAEFVRGDSHTR